MITENPTLEQPFFARMLAKVGGAKTPAALFDQGLVSGANFVTNVILARAFGLRDYGVFALAWVAVLFANSLQYALIVTPMMSIGPKQDPEERPSYYGAVLIQEGIFAVTTALIMFLSVRLSVRYYPQWGVGNLALPMSAATLAYLLQEFLRRYFFCTGQSKRALATDIVAYLTQLPIIFWMAHTHRAGLPSVLWIIAVTSLIGFLTCARWFETVTFDRESFNRVFMRHWLMSRWLAPAAFMQWGAGNLFLVAAPVYYGAAASAALRAAQNIVAVAHVWFLGLDNLVPAQASRQMRLNGVDGMLRYLKRVFVVWGGITLVFTTVVACFPTFWLHIAYGGKYASDGTVLRLYALLYLIIFTAGPLRAGLQALEYTSPIFWAYPVLIVFSVALAGPLARTLGLNGVMIGMCATQFICQSIICGALWLRIRRIRLQSQSIDSYIPE